MAGPDASAAGPGIALGLPPSVFPIYAATWHAATGRTASVNLLGNLAGAYLLRAVVIEASGVCSWDGATPFPSDSCPQVVWDHVERLLDLIGVMGDWLPDEPTVVDYLGFARCSDRPSVSDDRESGASRRARADSSAG